MDTSMNNILGELAEVQKLMATGDYRLALDKLDHYMATAGIPEAEWYVEELRSRIYMDLGEAEESIAHIWASVQCKAGLSRGRQQYNYSNYLFLQHYATDMPDERRRDDAFFYHGFELGLETFQHSRARHQAHKRLRIGYIAPYFQDNVVSSFSIQLLGAYDRRRFEVHCYVCGRSDDETAEYIRGKVDGWYETSREGQYQPRQMAERIYEDEIDILFDLGGHSAGGLSLQVAAYHPAPVQISGIGYMSTTGMRNMDYFLGDPYCDPPGMSEADFSERLLRLPHSHFCYTPTELAYKAKREREPHEGIVFGSFNNFLKVNERVLACWAEILRRVPDSCLLLKYMLTNPQAQRRFKSKMRAAGIPMERVTIENFTRQYMARYNAVDIALDTFPYVGGGTTCDALYMGVPVVSLYGRRHGTRFGYSLLMNAGLGELAAGSEEDYVEKAVALAHDKELLAALHKNIPQLFRQSPVMDARGYVCDVQEAYERVWQQWLAGKEA